MCSAVIIPGVKMNIASDVTELIGANSSFYMAQCSPRLAISQSVCLYLYLRASSGVSVCLGSVLIAANMVMVPYQPAGAGVRLKLASHTYLSEG